MKIRVVGRTDGRRNRQTRRN